MLLFIMLFLILLFWVISIFFNDIEDSLQYRYKQSIFDWINKKSWWSWYMVDPDGVASRKYVDGDKTKGRKKWYGIIIPAFAFDGWHGAKIIRQGFQWLTIYLGMLTALPKESGWWVLWGSLILFSILNHTCHNVWFFEGMFNKKWWDKCPSKKEWLLNKIG